MAEAPEIKTMGRPSEYSEQVADLICERMAGGESLHKICNDPGMPARSTILRWVSKNEEFGRRYSQAREALQDFWWDKAMEVAFDGSGDIIIENGKTKVDNENVQRSRLKVDTIKWTLSKLNPRKFGDTPDLTEGNSSGPLEIRWIEREVIDPLMDDATGHMLKPDSPEYRAERERRYRAFVDWDRNIRPGDNRDNYARAREPKLLEYKPKILPDDMPAEDRQCLADIVEIMKADCPQDREAELLARLKATAEAFKAETISADNQANSAV